LWDSAKSIPNGKFIDISAYIEKNQRDPKQPTNAYKDLIKTRKDKPKTNRRKEIIKIRVEINEMELKEQNRRSVK
jgi:hypothetical protein